MRGLTVFLLFCLGLASATVVQRHYEATPAGKTFLHQQRNVFELLYHVHQPNIHTEQVKLGLAYSIEDNLDKYSDVQAVKHFLQMYKDDLLPKGRIFSIVYSEQMHEAEALFKVFYYAKDYETFYKTACWAREHVNEQMFVYALSIAVLKRPDCRGIVLPPPYEIHPYYFFSSDVIEQAYFVKMQGHGNDVSPYVHTAEGNRVIISSNYSGWYVKYNEEQQLSYFTEDIGLNTFYYYFHLDYPFWMNGEEFGLTKDRRGELFYYIHQQILARYYLERLSNGLGEIPRFSWHWPVKTGYYPSLKYFNGMEFPTRPNEFKLGQEDFFEHLTQVEDYERRIRDTIDLGFVIRKDGSRLSLSDPKNIEEVASIIESNADCPNPRYFRHPLSVAKSLLGNSFRPTSWDKVAPSALEHYQTCLRDPAFYQLFERYIGYFRQFKNLFPSYTKEELTYPGVRIENVEVDKLITYFDHFDVDITNVVYQTKEERVTTDDMLYIKARQNRLNHVPFTVTTNVYSDKAHKVVFKYFLGPKYDVQGNFINLNENRLNFVELDAFVYELKSGKNTVQRNSREFIDTIKDFTSSRHVYSELISALNGIKSFPLDMSEAHSSFPDRLVLPKGRKGGMPFQLYVIVAPYVAPVVPYGTGFDQVVSNGVGSGARFIDGRALGYPFDRRVDEHAFLHTYTNMHFEDVLIFHKKETDINKPAHN